MAHMMAKPIRVLELHYPMIRFLICALSFSTVRFCDPFAPPINGSLVGVCNSEYNSVCRIKCNEGYELEGGSAHAEKKCIVNKNNHMEWTGGLPYCSRKIKVM